MPSIKDLYGLSKIKNLNYNKLKEFLPKNMTFEEYVNLSNEAIDVYEQAYITQKREDKKRKLQDVTSPQNHNANPYARGTIFDQTEPVQEIEDSLRNSQQLNQEAGKMYQNHTNAMMGIFQNNLEPITAERNVSVKAWTDEEILARPAEYLALLDSGRMGNVVYSVREAVRVDKLLEANGIESPSSNKYPTKPDNQEADAKKAEELDRMLSISPEERLAQRRKEILEARRKEI